MDLHLDFFPETGSKFPLQPLFPKITHRTLIQFAASYLKLAYLSRAVSATEASVQEMPQNYHQNLSLSLWVTQMKKKCQLSIVSYLFLSLGKWFVTNKLITFYGFQKAIKCRAIFEKHSARQAKEMCNNRILFKQYFLPPLCKITITLPSSSLAPS